uniref:Uncharacterized protein n=1 Tax=Anguilla anguilla TaxID=7936 RepID=A0A0E9VXB0_ANGAN
MVHTLHYTKHSICPLYFIVTGGSGASYYHYPSPIAHF